MAVMMILDWHGVSIEDYDRVNDEVGIRGDDDAPEGLISHVAAVDEDGEMVIADVWESDEALATFLETKLGPALQKLSLPESEPRIMPVHNRLRGRWRSTPAMDPGTRRIRMRLRRRARR
jgi:hypothetical protein